MTVGLLARGRHTDVPTWSSSALDTPGPIAKAAEVGR